MNREEALIEFLNGLRIAISSASAYPKEHPYFLKSAQDFKARIEAFLPILNPIKINIGPDFLLVAGQKLEKAALYADLASIFHLRKIKSLEFRPGLTIEEVANFLDTISRPIKDILKDGGISAVLKGMRNLHILAEELDYSGLLGDDGQVSKDVWLDIFVGVLNKEDEKKIDEFAKDFGRIIKNFRVEDILKDKNLRDSLGRFLAYVKEKDRERYFICAAELLSVLSQVKDSGAEVLSEMEVFFDGFNKESFARLADSNPAAALRVKEILTVSEDLLILPFYRHALLSIAKESAVKDTSLRFDRGKADLNFRYIILNLVKDETDPQKLKLICAQLAKLCEKAVESKDSFYLNNAFEVINNKISVIPESAAEFTFIGESIARYFEVAVFETDTPQEISSLAIGFKKSLLGFDYYIKQIFDENKVNPAALRCFFKFFTSDSRYFFHALKQRRTDLEFILKIIKSLEESDSAFAPSALANIFSFCNKTCRIEVIRALKNIPLKSRELVIDNVIIELLSISSPLGFNNDTLIENLGLVQDLNLNEARDLVVALSRRPFFWNRTLRARAKEVLDKI